MEGYQKKILTAKYILFAVNLLVAICFAILGYVMSEMLLFLSSILCVIAAGAVWFLVDGFLKKINEAEIDSLKGKK